jgi:hypothetical protein
MQDDKVETVFTAALTKTNSIIIVLLFESNTCYFGLSEGLSVIPNVLE